MRVRNVLLGLAISGLVFAQETMPTKKKTYDAPPKMTIDPAKKYTATMETNQGKVVIELFAKEAPKTVNNFVSLAKDGFYDGLIFHRVIPEFMIQGGDPEGTGSGGPGYQFEDEVGPDKPKFQEKGTLAMANAGPATNGSQFFITVGPTPHLQGRHTVFGQVKEGQDVVDKISNVPTGRADRPSKDVVIEKMTISEE